MNGLEMKKYFEDHNGLGVLATADKAGKVNAAVYSRPHVMDDDRVAFIMPHRLTHSNLLENPAATYLFHENGHGYKGTRLYLRMVREEKDTPLLQSLRRRSYSAEREVSMKPLYLVYFTVEKELPLIGAGDDSFEDIDI